MHTIQGPGLGVILIATTLGWGVATAGAASLCTDGVAEAPASFLRTADAALPDPRADFAAVVERVKPAVFGIRARVEESAPVRPQNSHLERLFREFGPAKNELEPETSAPRPRVAVSQGSGFFISADGYAVTTHHVVEHSRSVEIITDQGRTYAAKVVGADPRSDIALLKIDRDGSFPFVRLAQRTPRTGEWVLAVGSPFGLGSSVSAGIISARARDVRLGTDSDFLQIDAAVNQGNSGGPAFDINGDVVGVNSAIFSPSGGSVGIGFAIPADTVTSVVAQLRSKGAVVRGWLGVQVQAMTADMAEGLGLPETEGALVSEPVPGGPAAKAGIASGDVIISVNDAQIKDERDLTRIVNNATPGSSVRIGLLHKGQARSMAIVLGESPDPRPDIATGTTRVRPAGTDPSRLGLTLEPARALGPNRGQGVLVTSVDPDGEAAERGLEPGDVILEVAGKAVKTPADVQKLLREVQKEGRHVALMRVRSSTATRFISFRLG
jgi:serine protease Do